MSPATPQVILDRGRLEVAWPDGRATTGPISARILLTTGEEATAGGWRREGDAFATACGPARVRLTIKPRGATARMEIGATAAKTADVAEVGVTCSPKVAGVAPRWVVQNGYQSWDDSGVLPLSTSSVRPSYWTVGLADDQGRGLAAAALTARHSTTRFNAQATNLVVTAAQPGGLTDRPVLWRARRGGPGWRGEPLVLTVADDIRDGLASVARAAARGARRPDHVPQGWLSWYHYGPWVDWDDMLRNADAIATGPLKDLGYRYLQLDDGWQDAYGDWTPNPKFAGGLDRLAHEAAERDLILGIWTAPFLVSESSRLAREAPDSWFLKDPANVGRAVDPIQTAFGPMHILDARQPGVRRHLHETFARLYEAGIRYFKIDFLYAGGYGNTNALRRGVEVIRKAVKDSYLLACGAPLLPMVGLADGCRIGRDTATPMYDLEQGKPKPALLADEITDVGRNLAARHFLSPWFQLDPDVALVGGNLTLDQARTCVTYCALSGGPFFASDDLTTLSEDRLGLLVDPSLLDLVNRAAGPAIPDWDPSPDGAPPSVWRRDGTVAFFNWREQPKEPNSETDLTIPPHGVRLARQGQG